LAFVARSAPRFWVEAENQPEGQSDQSEQRAKHDDSTHAQDLSLEKSTL
jgi:hypothetical protein